VKENKTIENNPELGNGYKAALINFGYLANAVLSTNETVKAMA
jgi:hypothetical protein